MDARFQERLVGGVGTALIVGAIGAGLVLGLSVPLRPLGEVTTTLLDLRPPPPLPPERKPVRIEPPKRSPARHAPAPPNLRSQATPIVVPPPVIRLPAPPVMIAAPKPNVGLMAASGAADRPGTGEGAGGRGDGSGGGGDGDGGGTPPLVRNDMLHFSELPPELRQIAAGRTIVSSFTVETDGHVSGCRVTRSSGLPDLDASTCRLIERDFRYAPARDENGRKVRSMIVDQRSRWLMDRYDDKGSG